MSPVHLFRDGTPSAVGWQASVNGSLASLWQPRALARFREGLAIREEMGVPTVLAKNLLANLYMDMGDLERAAQFIRSAGYVSTGARFLLLNEKYDKARLLYGKFVKRGKRTGTFLICLRVTLAWEPLTRAWARTGRQRSTTSAR